MKDIIKIYILLALVFVCGCSNTPTGTRAVSIPSLNDKWSRIGYIHPDTTIILDSLGTNDSIIINQDTAYFGSLVKQRVIVDDSIITDFDTDSSLLFTVNFNWDISQSDTAFDFSRDYKNSEHSNPRYKFHLRGDTLIIQNFDCLESNEITLWNPNPPSLPQMPKLRKGYVKENFDIITVSFWIYLRQ